MHGLNACNAFRRHAGPVRPQAPRGYPPRCVCTSRGVCMLGAAAAGPGRRCAEEEQRAPHLEIRAPAEAGRSSCVDCGLWGSRRPPPATSSDRPASVTAVNVHPDVEPDELRGSVLCCVRHADLASCCPCKHGWLVVVFLYCVRHAILAPCCPQHTWLCGEACIAAAILVTHTFVWVFRVRVGALGPARAGCCWVTLCWFGGHILELLDGFMALPALPPLAL